jgi:hypothetical protein
MAVQRVDASGREIEVSPADEESQRRLQSFAAHQRDRWDLMGRLIGYKVMLLGRLKGFIAVGADAKWDDIVAALPHVTLPENAPGEARIALLSLQSMAILYQALIEAEEFTRWRQSRAMMMALCAAIDLGWDLQRGQAEIDLGEAVDLGRRNADSRKAAGSKRAAELEQRMAAAEAEYLRLRIVVSDGKPKFHTATLTNMAEQKLPDGKLKWGPLDTLKRWARKGQWERKVSRRRSDT